REQAMHATPPQNPVLSLAGGAAGDLDDDIRRLYNAHHRHSWTEAELLRCLGGHEAHQAELTCLHLDYRCDPVALDLGHDPRETVSRGLGNDRAIASHPTALGLKTADLRHGDEPLTAFGAADLQTAGRLPPAKSVDGDAEHFGRLPDADSILPRLSCC